MGANRGATFLFSLEIRIDWTLQLWRNNNAVPHTGIPPISVTTMADLICRRVYLFSRIDVTYLGLNVTSFIDVR